MPLLTWIQKLLGVPERFEKGRSGRRPTRRRRRDDLVQLYLTRLEDRRVLNADFSFDVLGGALTVDNFTEVTSENLTIRDNAVDGSRVDLVLGEGVWTNAGAPSLDAVAVDNVLTVNKSALSNILVNDNSGAGAGIDFDVQFGNLNLSSLGGALTFQNGVGDISQQAATSLSISTIDIDATSVSLAEAQNDFNTVILRQVTGNVPGEDANIILADENGLTLQGLGGGPHAPGLVQVTIDADNDGQDTLTVTGGLTVGSLELIGSDLHDDIFTFNADVTATAGIGDTLIVDNAGQVNVAANTTLSTANAGMRFATNDMSIDSLANLSAGTGTVTIENASFGRAIDLGTDAANTLGLTGAELDRITAGTLVIGRNDGAASGAITISNAISPAGTNTLHLRTGSTVTGTAVSGGSVALSNLAIDAGGDVILSNTTTAHNVDTLAIRTSAGQIEYRDADDLILDDILGPTALSAPGDMLVAALGDLTVTGNATKSSGGDATLQLLADNTIAVQGGILLSTSNRMNVVLNADRDADGSGAILLNAAAIIDTNGGDITLGGGTNPLTTAAVGTAANRVGIEIIGSELRSSTGNISLRGTGMSAGAASRGIVISAGSVVTSTSGDITLVGTGGGGSTDDNNEGILIISGTTGIAQVDATGSGNILLVGTGGSGTNFNNGVRILDQNPSATLDARVRAADGSLTIIGVGAGTGTDNHGVVIENGQVNSIFGAPISLTGSAGAGGGFGFNLIGTGEVAMTGTGDISVTADSMNIDATARIDASANTVTLRQQTSGEAIDLGGADAAGTLGLTDAELDRVTAALLVIGSSNSGQVNVTAGITRSSAIEVRSGDSIDFAAAGQIDAGAANVTLSSTDGIGGVDNGTADVIGGTVTLSVIGDHNIGDLGNLFEISATTLVATSGGIGDGEFFIEDLNGGLAVNGVLAREVTLRVVGGSLTSASVDGAADITAELLDLDVTGAGNNIGAGSGAANSLEINASSVDAVAANGGVFISNTGAGPLTVVNATSNGAGIEIRSAGAVAAQSVAASSPVTLIAATGNLTVGAVSAAGGDSILLEATEGSIVDDGSAGTVVDTTGLVQATAAGSIGAAGAALAVRNATELTVSAGGSLFADGGSSATLSNLDVTVDPSASPDAEYSLTNFGNLTSFVIDDVGANLDVTNVTAAGNLAVALTSLTGDMNVTSVSTSNQNISLTATAGTLDLANNAVNAGTATAALTAGASIVNGEASDATPNLIAGSAELDAGTGMLVDTDVNSLAARNAAGDIVIQNSGALTIAAVGGLTGITNTAGGGTIRAASPLVVNAAVSMSANFTLEAGTSSNPGDNLTINADVTHTGAAGAAKRMTLLAGDDILHTSGRITFGNSNAGDTVVMTADTEGVAVADGDRGGILQTGGDLRAAQLVQRAFDSISYTVATNDVDRLAASTSSGNFSFEDADDLTIANISGLGPDSLAGITAGGSADLTAGGSIVDANGDLAVDITVGTTLTLDAGGSIGTSAGERLEISAATLAAQAGGDAFLSEEDGLALGTINVGANDFDLLAKAGDITGAASAVTAADLKLQVDGAAAAIGTAAAPINVILSGALAASATSGAGGIFISSGSDLTVDSVQTAASQTNQVQIATIGTANLTLDVTAASFIVADDDFDLTSANGTITVQDETLSVRSLDLVNTGTGTVDVTGNVSTSAGVSVDTAATTASISGQLSGAGGLIKAGTGTLTLSGATTYTGSTDINAGTLQIAATGSTALQNEITVNADLIGTATLDVLGTVDGPVTVQTGGTLSGTGTVAGNVQVQLGGIFAPGSSPGILNTGNLTLEIGSQFVVDVNSPYLIAGVDYDQVNVTGSVSLGGAILTLVGGAAAPAGGEVLTIINNDGVDPVVGEFAGLVQGATITVGSFTGIVNYFGGDGNDVTLEVAAGAGGITPPAGVNDYVLRVNSLNNGLLEFLVDDGSVLNLIESRLLAGLSLYTVTGKVGESDTLTIDYTNGEFNLAIAFDGGGGAGTDSLFVTGGSFAELTYNTDATAGPGAGNLVFTDDDVLNTVFAPITFTGLEPVTVTSLLGTVTVNVDDGASGTSLATEIRDEGGSLRIDAPGTLEDLLLVTLPTVELIVNGDNDSDDTITIDSLPAGFTAAITINGGGGDDTITIDSFAGTFTGAVTINGGDGDDTININSLPGAFTGALTIDGGADNDTININTNLTLTLAGATLDLTAETVNLNAASITAVDGISIDADTANLGALGSAAILLQTDGGDVDFAGPTDVVLRADLVTIDTELNDNSPAGDVLLADSDVSADATGHALTIDTSTAAALAAGDVSLGVFGNAAGQLVNTVNIESLAASAALDGELSLGGLITLAAGADFTFEGGQVLFAAAGSLALTGTSAARLTASTKIKMNAGSSISTEAGNITLEANLGGAAVGPSVGIELDDADISSVDGDISLSGRGGSTGGGNTGVLLQNLATVTSTGTLTGDDAANITIDGDGGGDATATGPDNHGILILGGARVQSATAAIDLDGIGGSALDEAAGIRLEGTNSTVVSSAGAIDLVGLGGVGPGGAYDGIQVFSSAKVESTGTATITLDGTGRGDATSRDNLGVALENAGVIESIDGAILIEGFGGLGIGGDHKGIGLSGNSIIRSTGAATISLDGTGGSLDGLGAGGTLGENTGVAIEDGSLIQSTGSGFIEISGSAGTDASHGVVIDGTTGLTIIETTSTLATADIGIEALGGNLVMIEDSQVRSNQGDIGLRSTADVLLTIVNADADGANLAGIVGVQADSNLDGSGAITDNLSSEAANIIGSAALLLAGDGIGSDANDINLDVDTVAAVTGSGDIHLRNDGELDIAAVTINVGLETPVIATAAGAQIAGGASGDNLTIRAASPLNVLAAVLNNAGGDVLLAAEGITSGDVLTIDADVTASGGNGNVTLLAGGDILHETGTVSAVGAGSVLLSAGEDFNGGANQNGFAAAAITMADTVNALVQTENGDITLRAPGEIALSRLNSTGGDAFVTADFGGLGGVLSDNIGAIADGLTGDATANIIANRVELRAATGIGSGTGVLDELADIDIDAVTLFALNTTLGDVQIFELNDVALDQVSNLTRRVVLDAAGRITDADSGNDAVANVTAAELVARAGTGIGDGLAGDGTDLNTAVDTAALETGSGDINVRNTGGLTVAALGGLVHGAIIVNGSASDDLTIVAASPLTIDDLVENNGGGDITLTADGVLAGDDLEINADITALGGDGSIFLTAGDEIRHNTGTISADGNGDISLFAQRITMAVDTTIAATLGDVTLDANTGAFSMASGAQVTTAGNVFVAADTVILDTSAAASLIAATGAASEVVLAPETGARAIDLGGISVADATFELNEAELNTIEAPRVRIGVAAASGPFSSATAGAITFVDDFTADAEFATEFLALQTTSTVAALVGAVVDFGTSGSDLAVRSGAAITFGTDDHNFNTIAATTGPTDSNITFRDGINAMTVGVVDTLSGITTGLGVVALNAADVTLGDLLVNAPITTSGGLVDLDAGRDIISNAAGTVTTTAANSLVISGAVDVLAGRNVNLAGTLVTSGANGAAAPAVDINGGFGGAVAIQATNGSLDVATIITTGGRGGDNNEAVLGNAGNGGTGGAVLLTTLDGDATFDGNITAANINTSGGRGGDRDLGDGDAGDGGVAGLLTVTAAGGSADLDNVTALGGIGGDRLGAGTIGFAGNGGNNFVLTHSVTADNNIDLGTFDLSGGNGGSGAPGTGTFGGDGGDGAQLNLLAGDDIVINSFISSGGVGGIGEVVTGGQGGDAGLLDANAGERILAATINALGGTGGAGVPGGFGGLGGQVLLFAAGTSVPPGGDAIDITSINVTGGTGGTSSGGTAGFGVIGGTGGFVQIEAAAGDVALEVVRADGADGGEALDPGTGGLAGGGGALNVTATNGFVFVNELSATGGDGGTGSGAGESAGQGGLGGTALLVGDRGVTAININVSGGNSGAALAGADGNDGGIARSGLFGTAVTILSAAGEIQLTDVSANGGNGGTTAGNLGGTGGTILVQNLANDENIVLNGRVAGLAGASTLPVLGGLVTLNTQGAIVDSDETQIDIEAFAAELSARNGIAGDAAADPDNAVLEVDVELLAAVTLSGDIVITDVADGLELGDVGALTGALGGVRIADPLLGSADDNIVIVAFGPLTVSSAVLNLVGGDILLVARATDALIVNANVTATSGNVLLDADTGLFQLAGGAQVTATADGDGVFRRIVISADSIDVQGTVRGIEQNDGNIEVLLAPDSADVAVNLGQNANAAGGFALDDAELNGIESPVVRIGAGAELLNKNDDSLVDDTQADLARPFLSQTTGAITFTGAFTADADFATQFLALQTTGAVTGTAAAIDLGSNLDRGFAVRSGGAIDFGTAAHNFNTVAATTGPTNSAVTFRDGIDALTVGTVDDVIPLVGITTGNATVLLQTVNAAAGDVTIASPISTDPAGGTVRVLSARAIIDGSDPSLTAPDIVANAAELVAATGIAGLAAANAALELDVSRLAAITQSGGIAITDIAGGVTIDAVETTVGVSTNGGLIVLRTLAGGDISLAQLVQSPGGRVDLHAAGAIVDVNDPVAPGAPLNNILANQLLMTAASGIGSALDPVDTEVSNLAASTTTGGIFVDNQGPLTIGGVPGLTFVRPEPLVGTAALVIIPQAQSTPVNINVTTSGDLIVADNIFNKSGGQIRGESISGTVRFENDAEATSSTGVVKRVAPLVANVDTPQVSATGNVTLSFDLGVGDTSVGNNVGTQQEENFTYTVFWGDGSFDQVSGVDFGQQSIDHTYIGSPNANAADPIQFVLAVANDPNINFFGDNIKALGELAGGGPILFTGLNAPAVFDGFDVTPLQVIQDRALSFTTVNLEFPVPGEGFGAFVFQLNTGGAPLFVREAEPLAFFETTQFTAFTQSQDFSVGAADQNVVDEREVVLEILQADGTTLTTVTFRGQEADDVLNNLPKYLKKLPDGRYRILLKEPGEERLRLIRDLLLRDGVPSDSKLLEQSDMDGQTQRTFSAPPAGRIAAGEPRDEAWENWAGPRRRIVIEPWPEEAPAGEQHEAPVEALPGGVETGRIENAPAAVRPLPPISLRDEPRPENPTVDSAGLPVPVLAGAALAGVSLVQRPLRQAKADGVDRTMAHLAQRARRSLRRLRLR